MLGKKKHLTDELTPIDQLAGAMVGVGALNWGLIGLTNLDAVRMAFGKGKGARAFYALVGASALYAVARGRSLSRH